MKTIHQVHQIESVFRYFAKAFQLAPGQRCAVDETIYDPRTGKVVFLFYVDEPEEPQWPPTVAEV